MSDIALKILPLALAYIMYTLGMSLQVSDFKVIAKNPKAFLMGFFNQVFILPLVALAIIFISNPAPELAFGILLLSFCPGGMTSNLLSFYAKGNVALSIALTGVVSLLSIISLPLFITLGYRYFIHDDAQQISMLKMGIAIFVLTTLPVLLGMLTRHKFTAFCEKNYQKFSAIAGGLFVLIVLAAIISNWATLITHLGSIGMELIIMMLLLLSIGVLTSKMLGLSWYDTKTVALESGIQNGATAISLSPIIVGTATSLPMIALPAAVYSVLMYLIAFPFILWVRHKN